MKTEAPRGEEACGSAGTRMLLACLLGLEERLKDPRAWSLAEGDNTSAWADLKPRDLVRVPLP